jgi:hypothetical protein
MAQRSVSEKVRPKTSYFSFACEYVKLLFSLRVPKIVMYLCIKAKKCIFFCLSLGFLVEAEPRLENRRGQKALFGLGAH